MRISLISGLLLLTGCAAGLDSITYRPVQQEGNGLTFGVGSLTIATQAQDASQPRALPAPTPAPVDALTLLMQQAAASGVPITIQIGATPAPVDIAASRGLDAPLPLPLPVDIVSTPLQQEDGHALVTPRPTPVKTRKPRRTPAPVVMPAEIITPMALPTLAPVDAANCLTVWQPYHERLLTLLRKKGYTTFTTCDTTLFDGAFVIPMLFADDKVAMVDAAMISETYALEQKGYRVLKVNAELVNYEVSGKTNTISSWLSCFVKQE